MVEPRRHRNSSLPIRVVPMMPRIQGRPPDRPVMRRQWCDAAGRADCI